MHDALLMRYGATEVLRTSLTADLWKRLEHKSQKVHLHVSDSVSFAASQLQD